MGTIKEIIHDPLLAVLVFIGLAYITAFAVVYLLKARKRALEMGITKEEINNIIKSSLVFSIVPSLSIVIGLVALSTALGTIWSWWRLSVIGSLSFETQIASTLSSALGFSSTGDMVANGTAKDFGVIMILMSCGMLSGFLIQIPFGKKLMNSVDNSKKGSGWSQVLSGCFMLTLMAVYVPLLLLGNFKYAAVMMSGMVVAVALGVVAKKPGMAWVSNFIMAGSMIFGMLSSLLWDKIL